tara:strand:+ start:133 stop:336 length:204 start_codon:yes stop_codon:yes gene_type:complete
MTKRIFDWSTQKAVEGFDAVVGSCNPRKSGDYSDCDYKEVARVSCSTRARAKTKAIKMVAELEAQQS